MSKMSIVFLLFFLLIFGGSYFIVYDGMYDLPTYMDVIFYIGGAIIYLVILTLSLQELKRKIDK